MKAEDHKALYASIIGSAMDAIIIVDGHHRVYLFNQAAEQIFRCPAADAVGAPLNKFIPARFHEAHTQHMRKYAETSASMRSMHAPGRITGVRADGEEFPAEATISQGAAGGERFFAVILRDITERRKHEDDARRLQQLEAEQELRLYQHELAIAGAIQQQLMRSDLPQVPFAAVRAHSAPCKEVGGDFFDAIETKDGIAVVIADVCGKGIPAGLLASTLQGMLHTQLATHVPLADIAVAVNQFLCRRSDLHNYATMLFGHLRPDGMFRYVSCGHIPPLLISGGTFRPLDRTNLPLGLFPDAVYQLAQYNLRRGDTVLLATDGFTEAVNCKGEQFGDALPACEEVRPEECFDRILQAFTAFRGDAPLEDDCTVLTLEYRGAEQALPAAAF